LSSTFVPELHWDDLNLSTNSMDTLTVGAEPLSDVLTTPSVRRVDAVETGTATTKVPSTASPVEGAEPSSDISTTPSVPRLGAVKRVQ